MMAECFEERISEENVEEDSIKIIIRILRGLGAFSRFMNEMSSAQESEHKSFTHDLPEEKIDENEGQCLICLKEYVKGEVVKQMPCKHLFHSICLFTWLERSNSCPLCRCELATESFEQTD